MHSWSEIEMDLPSSLAETVGSFLFDIGCCGTETAEDGSRTTLRAYFDRPPDIGAILRLTFSLAESSGDASFVIRRTSIDDQDWKENWKADFHPIEIGTRFFVHPPWIAPAPPFEHSIEIDPGMAFGTGQHATTRGCLSMIDRHLPSPPWKLAIDLGTGSGILAIALAKAGVNTWALDNDPLACEVAATNAERNGAAIRLGTVLEDVPAKADVIIANLFADLLVKLAEPMTARLSSGGKIACSGFLTADEPRVAASFEAQGLHIADRIEEEGWVTLWLEAAGEGT